MDSITILLQPQPDGSALVHHYVGGDIAPAVAASACRIVAEKFDELVIEAEIERRLAERLKDEGEADGQE